MAEPVAVSAATVIAARPRRTILRLRVSRRISEAAPYSSTCLARRARTEPVSNVSEPVAQVATGADYSQGPAGAGYASQSQQSQPSTQY